jgi:hypothetical protein
MSDGVMANTVDNAWSTALAALWQNAPMVPQLVFPLDGQPVASSIVVTVGGTPASGWTYNAANNTIVFAQGSGPAEGQPVSVTYTVTCS